MIHFLVHNPEDNVGVAVVDIPAGTECVGRNLENSKAVKAHAKEAIPLGHKLALKDLSVDDTAIKYGCDIGKIAQTVKSGHHVHTHNLKTKRWA